MTPMDVEAMVNNLDLRLTSAEQILPTLATKEDLKALATKEDLKAFATKTELAALRTDMLEKFDEARHFALVLHEDLKGQIGLIAEHLADVMRRLPPRA
jgi:hypothetical protein